MREAGTRLSGNINYVGVPMGSLIRAIFLSRNNLPAHFGINSRGAFYERNGEDATSGAREWKLAARKYKL